MDRRTSDEIDFLVSAPLGFYQRADLLVRTLTRENVEEIMARLPPAFRREFVEFAREAYLPQGERLVVAGPPVPAACLDAVRYWLGSQRRVRQMPAAWSVAIETLARRIEGTTSHAVPAAPTDLVLEEARSGELGVPRRPAPCT